MCFYFMLFYFLLYFWCRSSLCLLFIYIFFRYHSLCCVPLARVLYTYSIRSCVNTKKNALEFLSSPSLVEAGKNPLSLSTAAECTENTRTQTNTCMHGFNAQNLVCENKSKHTETLFKCRFFTNRRSEHDTPTVAAAAAAAATVGKKKRGERKK